MKINHLKVAEDMFRKSIETRRADARSSKEAAPEISKWQINKETDDVLEEPSDIGLVQKESDDARWQRIKELLEGLELSLLRYVFFSQAARPCAERTGIQPKMVWQEPQLVFISDNQRKNIQLGCRH